MKTRTARQQFWANPPHLPPELRMSQFEPVVVRQAGPQGAAVFDLAQLRAPAGEVHLLMAHKAPLLARDVGRLKQRLDRVIAQRRERELATGQPVVATLPTIATDAASPSVVDACHREGVALIDRRGTMIVTQGPVYVHVIGKRPVERAPQLKLFQGKPSRIVRFLLVKMPFEARRAWSVQAIASETDTSYAYAHRILGKLEREGYLDRQSPRSGFRLTNTPGLLRAWMDSGEPTAVSVDAFNAPDTSPERLEAARQAMLTRGGRAPLFTLASGLTKEETHVSGLPHGAYVSTNQAMFAAVLGLRRITPQNFWVLTPDPILDTPAGGIQLGVRQLAHGMCVALPQLCADVAQVRGRGREQAQFLLERYTRELPLEV